MVAIPLCAVSVSVLALPQKNNEKFNRMSQIQKQVSEIDDIKVIKIFEKPFTKQIINCFDDAPKTASEIAQAVAFPKDKIYYHLKKLLSVKIIFITETDIVKGIEQKKYFQTLAIVLVMDMV